MPSGMDYTREAQKIWDALRPMVDQEIKKHTQSVIRARKMMVITPPDGQTIGVQEPYGTTVNIPYSTALSGAVAGDSVWVVWFFNNASTMIAMLDAYAQPIPQYATLNVANENLLAVSNLIQTTLDATGMLADPSAPAVTGDYDGFCTTSEMIPVQGGSAYRLTLYDDRIENVDGTMRISQYTSGRTFISNALANVNWKEANAQTVLLSPRAAYVRISVIGYPLYRWKFEKGASTTDWQISPHDVL